LRERWKVIKDYPNYRISSKGRLYSKRKLRCVNPEHTKKGYLRYRLFQNGSVANVYAHVLVARAFIPNPENKPQVNHLDGVKANNHVENLDWVTNSENMQHAYDTGIISRKRKIDGIPIHTHKTKPPRKTRLTIFQVREIRKSQLKGSQLAKIYGVTRATISLIRLNKIYQEGCDIEYIDIEGLTL
jgi:DNA-binding transcriptional regulator YiaG